MWDAAETRPLASEWRYVVGFCLLGLLPLIFCYSDWVWADDSESGQPPASTPWFTGTLLSTRGSTVESGHLVVDPYFYSTRYGGLYNTIGGPNQRTSLAPIFSKPISSME